MAAPDVDRLGRRLREEREKRGVSVRGLARDVGVSASMVSQIETGKSQPSVSTLYAITTALGITVEELFSPSLDRSAESAASHAAPTGAARRAAPPGAPGAAAAATPATPAAAPAGQTGAGYPPVGQSGDRPAGAYPETAWRNGPRLGPLVRPSQRRVLELDSGVTWELLGDLPQHTVDFILVTYQPGGTSSSRGGLMRHPGSEYGYLLSGELVLTLGFEEMVLRPGDSICFDSTTPHSYRNEGTVPAVGVWFVIERPR